MPLLAYCLDRLDSERRISAGKPVEVLVVKAVAVEEVAVVAATMEVLKEEDHGEEGRKIGEEAEAGDETHVSQVTAQANHTPHIVEEPSTIPFYTIIDTHDRVLVVSEYKSFSGTESVIIPREHKVESIDTGNNNRKNITDNNQKQK